MLTIIAALACTVCGTDVTPDALANHVTRIRERINASEHSFEYIELRTRRASDSGEWNENDRQNYARLRVIERGERYRIEALPARDAADQALIRLATWDGERYMTKEERSVGVWAAPRVILQQATALFCETAGSALGLRDLAEAVRIGVVLEQQTDGDRLVHRFRFAETENQIMTLTMRLGEQPRIEELRLALFKRDNLDGPPTTEWSYRVIEWTRVGDDELPRLAHTECEADSDIFERGKVTRVVQRSIYQRESISDLTANPPPLELFTIPVEPGDSVLDQRTKIGWTSGQSHVLVDGVAYALPDPVTEDPYERLGDLLPVATRLAEPEPSQDTEVKAAPERWRAGLYELAVLPLLILLGKWAARTASRS